MSLEYKKATKNKVLPMKAELYDLLNTLARFRGITIPELIIELLESVEDSEFEEISMQLSIT